MFHLGPTPLHAPRPLPLTAVICIGTSDFGAATSDAGTQGGPPPLELSSFLNDLSLTATSSPLLRPLFSVLSPTFQQFLDAGTTADSPPHARVAISQGTSTRHEVQHVDVATCTDGLLSFADRAVSAVVVSCTVATHYDPPPVLSAVASPAFHDPLATSEHDAVSIVPSYSTIDPPDDFS